MRRDEGPLSDQLSEYVEDPKCFVQPESNHAVIFHHGSRSSVHESYYQLLEFIEREGVEPCGDAIEADFVNYLSDRNEDKHIRQLSIPVRKKG